MIVPAIAHVSATVILDNKPLGEYNTVGELVIHTYYYWLNEIGDGAIKILMDEI